jgi:DNA-binding GntR family transcriptional regulator
MKGRPTEPNATTTDRLRAHVLNGTLAPGSRLVELQLAQRYAVSRAAVRAAIGELAKEGLVEREANRGATVRAVDLAEAVRITEIRALLEGFIAARAAHVATPKEHQELLDLIAGMAKALDDDRMGTYSDLNATLHRRLREISGHNIAADLVENLRNRAAHHAFRLAMFPGRAEESLPQHRAIVDAVVAGDADRAEQAMRAHLTSVISALQRWAQLENLR